MTIFDRTHLKTILNKKVSDKEIFSYTLCDEFLIIKKSKKNNIQIDFNTVSPKELIKCLAKKIPINIELHFKVELRSVKLRNLFSK